jgi:hypothetical protein
MKWVSVLFLFIGATSCIRQGETAVEETYRSDTGLVQVDTAIARVPAWDPVADSLAEIRTRDSFFAIPPRKVFISSPASFCWDQCAAFFLDTTKVYRERLKVNYDFEPVTNWKSELIANRYRYSWDNFTLEVNEPDPENYHPQQFTMNGWPLEPGVRLDTSVAGEWFLSNISLAEDEFWRLTVGPRHFIEATGFIRHCTGKACGQLYHFLYDLENQKVLVIDEYRGYRLYAGYNKRSGNVEFLKRDEGLSEQYNCLFEEGKVLTLFPNGRISYKTNNDGNIVGYKAYFPLNEKEDRLVLYDLNR